MLHGTKLRGGFSLLRTGMVGQKERWLLVKQRDGYADPSWDIESARLDRSALTGRSMKEIENDRPKNVRRLRHAHARMETARGRQKTRKFAEAGRG
jgi:bifunctional non-homologous end joining protein LigD